MFELNENQKREDFNDRLKRFQVDLKALSDNYKLMLEPTLHYTPKGIIPVLSINDTKYATSNSKESPVIIPKEQLTPNEKSLENDKETMERNPEIKEG